MIITGVYFGPHASHCIVGVNEHLRRGLTLATIANLMVRRLLRRILYLSCLLRHGGEGGDSLR